MAVENTVLGGIWTPEGALFFAKQAVQNRGCCGRVDIRVGLGVRGCEAFDCRFGLLDILSVRHYSH